MADSDTDCVFFLKMGSDSDFGFGFGCGLPALINTQLLHIEKLVTKYMGQDYKEKKFANYWSLFTDFFVYLIFTKCVDKYSGT